MNAFYSAADLQLHADLQAADLSTLFGALQIALTEANQTDCPDEKLELRRLATNINIEIGRRS